MRKRLWIYAALFFIVAALLFVYGKGLNSSSYIIDDQSLINIPQLQNKDFFSFIFNLFKYSEFHIDFYPVRDFSYWIDIHWFGAKTNPADSLFIFRVHNFILFYLLTLVIYEIIRQLHLVNACSLWLFLIWVIHPYHSELLMWVTSRKDLLGLLFSGLFLLTFLKSRERFSFPLAVLNFLSLLGAGWSKNIISTVSLLVGLYLLVTASRPGEKFKRGVWGGLILVSSLWFAWQSRFFYSSINDMRFSYTWEYRLTGVLASLGRMITGWFYPQVNAIDVFNWGDWAYRNAKFIPAAVLLVLFLSYLFLRGFKDKKPHINIYIGLFIAAYLPVSALLFPHRNFYSVRYFELPSLFLLFLAMDLLRKKSASALLAMGFVGCLITQYYERPHWETPMASIDKALSLDPTNPSLLSEREFFNQGQNLLLEECQKKLQENSPISDNGDLCWFDIMSHSADDRQREAWLLRHAGKHSELFHSSTQYYFNLFNLIRSSKAKFLNPLPQPPPGFLNNLPNREIYLTSLCLLSETPERDRKLKSLTSLFFDNHLMDHDHFLRFSPALQEKLELCFPRDLRNNFLDADWKKTFEKHKNILDIPGFGDWWLQSLRDGAPGSRYGCGYQHQNKYDCGSTMDQGSMVNLFVELHRRTQEPVFLKEAFLYARNGNQMCSLLHHSSGACADGKGQGTWMLALLKLYLASADLTTRTALLQQLRLPPSDLMMNDSWDFFEIYRSYLLGFLILPESRQENFFQQLREIVLAKNILGPNQAMEVSHFLNCAYKGDCPSSKTLLTLSDPLLLASVDELMAMKPSLSTFFQRSAGGSQSISINQLLSSARTALSQCSQKNLDKRGLTNFLQKYQGNEFPEIQKPFYYAQEGDNFAPVMLAAFNQMFASEKGCAYWGLSPAIIKQMSKLYHYREAERLIPQRRPLFLLSQIHGLKSRIWLVNNTADHLSLNLSRTCKLPFPAKILIKAGSSREYFTTLPRTFKMNELTACEYTDPRGGKHALYP